jgi:hypothetical protein
MVEAQELLSSALRGRYTVLREIGSGAMATVYLAEDLRHDRKVAIKVLKPVLAEILGAERFLTEIRTTANLQHPHILPLFDSGDAGGFLFYVMPYVAGESLRHRLARERQLPVSDALMIASGIASALDHAHRHGVIHRDIKPGNSCRRRPASAVNKVATLTLAIAISTMAAARSNSRAGRARTTFCCCQPCYADARALRITVAPEQRPRLRFGLLDRGARTQPPDSLEVTPAAFRRISEQTGGDPDFRSTIRHAAHGA